jgi:hypothetical protein
MACYARANGLKERLKSIDIVVKNCCRPVAFKDGSGISNPNFIRSFEKLVTSAVRALGTLKALNFVRIRFIDLGMSFMTTSNIFCQN